MDIMVMVMVMVTMASTNVRLMLSHHMVMDTMDTATDIPSITQLTHMVMDTMVSINVKPSHHMDTTAMDTQATVILDIMEDTLMSMSAVTDMAIMVSTNVRLSHLMDTTATDTQAMVIITDIMVDTPMSM